MSAETKGPAQPDVFAPCGCVIIKLKADADGNTIVTRDMSDAFWRAFTNEPIVADRGAIERMICAALAVAPRLKAERSEIITEGLAWLDTLAVHDRHAVTERARRQEQRAAALARFVRLALGEAQP